MVRPHQLSESTSDRRGAICYQMRRAGSGGAADLQRTGPDIKKLSAVILNEIDAGIVQGALAQPRASVSSPETIADSVRDRQPLERAVALFLPILIGKVPHAGLAHLSRNRLHAARSCGPAPLPPLPAEVRHIPVDCLSRPLRVNQDAVF